MGAALSPSRARQRILMTTDAVGGVWTYALELARELVAAGIEVHLAVLGPAPSSEQLRAAANIAPFQSHARGGGRLEGMDDPWSDVASAGEWLLELCDSIEPMVVHLNDYSHASLPWRCPCIVVAHSCVCTWWRSVKKEPAPLRYEEYRRRLADGLAAAAAIVAPTNAFRDQFIEEHGLCCTVETVPNARSAEMFSPGKKKPRILSAGRLWDEGKNLALLDRIASRVRMEIVIAGGTELENVSRFETRALRCLGKLDQAAVSRELATAAIYAAPALYEPFGLAILEAGLSGCALVLSDIPTLRENWAGCARFVPANDEEAWITTLNELCENETELERLQSLARARALTFTTARQGLAYRQLYRAVSTGFAAHSPRPAFA